MNRLEHAIRRAGYNVLANIAMRVMPVRWKQYNELKYWKERKAKGLLSDDNYKYFYTSHFGLDESYYSGKTILDIGCGPKGSLEWAAMAKRRIGLDPLAKEYLKLGAARHQMEYIDSPAENIPLQDSECDAVFSFNSLDHVHDIARTIKEIKRILRAGGIFLLLVEVNHPPTACEPHKLTPGRLIEWLKPEFVCKSLQLYRPAAKGMYASILANEVLPNPEDSEEIGYMSAHFVRTSAR